MFAIKNQPNFDFLNREVRLFDEGPVTIAKRYVNPAVRVEMSVCDTPPFKKNIFCRSFVYEDNPKHVTIKTCTCAIDRNACPSHATLNTDRSLGDGYPVHRTGSVEGGRPRTASVCSRTSFQGGRPLSVFDSEASNCTIVPNGDYAELAGHDELKLSLVSLAPSNVTNATEKRQRENTFQMWLAEKDKLKRKVEEEHELLQAAIFEEREKKVEFERQNFLNWLKTKKTEERKKKIESEQKTKEKELMKVDKEQSKLETELKFQLWLKQKEEVYLENKLREQVEKLKAAEDRKKRIEMNAAAYEDWLKNSKYKPKPIPLNRGLESNHKLQSE